MLCDKQIDSLSFIGQGWPLLVPCFRLYSMYRFRTDKTTSKLGCSSAGRRDKGHRRPLWVYQRVFDSGGWACWGYWGWKAKSAHLVPFLSTDESTEDPAANLRFEYMCLLCTSVEMHGAQELAGENDLGVIRWLVGTCRMCLEATGLRL